MREFMNARMIAGAFYTTGHKAYAICPRSILAFKQSSIKKLWQKHPEIFSHSSSLALKNYGKNILKYSRILAFKQSSINFKPKNSRHNCKYVKR